MLSSLGAFVSRPAAPVELYQRCYYAGAWQISTQTLDNFLTRLEQGYSKFGNPYHNLVHAADVTQTTHHLFSQSGLVVSALCVQSYFMWL